MDSHNKQCTKQNKRHSSYVLHSVHRLLFVSSDFILFFQLSWLSYSYKLVKMLSLCVCNRRESAHPPHIPHIAKIKLPRLHVCR